MTRRQRQWSLEAARALFPEVRRRTEAAVVAVEELQERRGAVAEGGAEARKLDERIRERVSLWVREMEALGLEVKGPWLVDFDNGAGCFCWRWPEEELAYFHGYEEGFAGRVRIQ